MIRNCPPRLSILMCIGFVGLWHPAKADVAFALNTTILSGPPASTVMFSGLLENMGFVDVYLNGDFTTISSVSLAVDDTPLLTLVPPVLTAGGLYSGPIFTVIIGADALPGTYVGEFDILGGSNDTDGQMLANTAFQVDVTSIPEPANIWLVGVVLPVLRMVRSIYK